MQLLKRKNVILKKQVIQVKLEDEYYSKLYHSLKTDQLTEEIDSHHFSHFLGHLNNCFYCYSKL